MISLFIYLPLAKLANIINKIGLKKISKLIPLEYYKDKSFMIMRNDSLDRFGTPLEQRFSKEFINNMLIKNNFIDVKFSKYQPYYHVIATKKK